MGIGIAGWPTSGLRMQSDLTDSTPGLSVATACPPNAENRLTSETGTTSHDDVPLITILDRSIAMPSPKDTGGPIVKTGPTAGQVRSQNKDGTWHGKRSDADKPRDKKR